MASSKRLELLEHLKSTNQGHKISDILSLLKEFGFVDTGSTAGKETIFVNGDTRVSLLVSDKQAYVPRDTQSKIKEACETILARDEKKPSGLSALKDVLNKESQLVAKLESDYEVTISINEKTGQIVFESKECNLKKVINHRQQPFDLESEIQSFTNELDSILEARLEELGILEDLSDKFTQLEGKDILEFGDEKVGIKYFGAGFPTYDSLKNAQATYERSLQSKTPSVNDTNVQTQPPNASAASPVVIIILGPSHNRPTALDHTRHITGGNLPKDVIAGKQRMWDILKTITGMKNDNVFLPIISEAIGMKKTAFIEFFDPTITTPPQRRAQSAMSVMQKKVFDFVKEAQDDKKVPRGTLKQFKEDFKALKGEIETAKEQWGRI